MEVRALGLPEAEVVGDCDLTLHCTFWKTKFRSSVRSVRTFNQPPFLIIKVLLYLLLELIDMRHKYLHTAHAFLCKQCLPLSIMQLSSLEIQATL